MEVALERAGEVRGDCAETGWRVAENRRGRDWLPALWAQRAARAACGLLPPSLGGPCPPPPRTVTSKQPGPFILYSGAIKITTKTLQKILREFLPSPPAWAPETPGQGKRREEGETVLAMLVSPGSRGALR